MDKVDRMEAQEIIAQMRRNQEMISILVGNNDRLMEFLLTKGIHGLLREEFKITQELEGNDDFVSKVVEVHRRNKEIAAANNAPEVSPKKDPSAKDNLKYPPKFGDKMRMIIEWAIDHGGKFDLAEFRSDYTEKGLGSESFVKTSIYTSCKNLMDWGVFRKVRPGRYQLNKKGLEKLAEA